MDDIVSEGGGGGSNDVGSGTREDGVGVARGVGAMKLVATEVISSKEVDWGLTEGDGGGIVSWRATKDGLEVAAHSSLILQ